MIHRPEMAICYITFGQKYAREAHPVDGRAHPDGWFEYVADTYAEALAAARRHLLGDDGHGNQVALFAFDYEDRPSEEFYPRGCLARPTCDGTGNTGTHEQRLTACPTCDGTGTPRWVALFGADPDITEGTPVDQWLEHNRGEA